MSLTNVLSNEEVNKMGLNANEQRDLLAALAFNKHVQKAIVFGSRAKGNFKAGSDVDVCLFGPQLTIQDVVQLGIALEENHWMRKFDFVIYPQITNPDLIAHIERVGKLIFERTHNEA